jgi:hypothetical protein
MKNITYTLVIVVVILTILSCDEEKLPLKQPTFMGLCIGQTLGELNEQFQYLKSKKELDSFITKINGTITQHYPYKEFKTKYGTEDISYLCIIVPQTEFNYSATVTALNIYFKTYFPTWEHNGYAYVATKEAADNYITAYYPGEFIPEMDMYFDIRLKYQSLYGYSETSTITNEITFKYEDGISVNAEESLETTNWIDESRGLKITLKHSEVKRPSYPLDRYYNTILRYEFTDKFKKQHKKELDALKKTNIKY